MRFTEMRSWPVVFSFIAGTLFTAGSGLAQSVTDGAIGGTVTDPTNAVVAGASVSVRNLATNATTPRPPRMPTAATTRSICSREHTKWK
jgi:hypothetical protein